MNGRLPQITPMELIRALEKLGFILRRTSGSHYILRHPVTKRVVSVPVHSKELKRGLLFGIIKQAGVAHDEIRGML